MFDYRRVAALQTTELFLIAIVQLSIIVPYLIVEYFQWPFTVLTLFGEKAATCSFFWHYKLYLFGMLRSFQWKMYRGSALKKAPALDWNFDTGSALET